MKEEEEEEEGDSETSGIQWRTADYFESQMVSGVCIDEGDTNERNRKRERKTQQTIRGLDVFIYFCSFHSSSSSISARWETTDERRTENSGDRTLSIF